jgi:hypothetical protein
VYLCLFTTGKALEGATMKTAIKTMMIGVAACAFAAPAFAYTLTGTVPPNGKPVVIQLQKPIPHNVIMLTLNGPPGPPPGPGVTYPMTFCISSAANPCPLPILVPQGLKMIASFLSGSLVGNTITISQVSKVAVPYTLEVEILP